jgi:phosphatidate cytidylyltransferase
VATRRAGAGSARTREARARRARRPRRRGTSTGARILIALPWIAVALFAVYFDEGNLLPFLAIGLGIVGLGELYELLRPVRPITLAGFLSVAGIILAARYGDAFQIVLLTALSVPLAFVLALARPERRHVTLGIAATLLGVIWVGFPLAHAVLLRGLDHGDGLLVDVLIATFLGDTGAYFGGRLWGTRPLAPRISPAKTVEGLVAGILVGTMAFWFAGLYQDWLSGLDALVLGLCVALAAPLGDLLESLVKRDVGVKDSGRLFGEHGGVLDRLDAAFFTVVVGYYVAKALGY